MRKSIDIHEESDPRLLDVSLSDDDAIYSLIIAFKTKQETDEHRNAVKAHLKLAESISPQSLDFSIDFSDIKSIKLVGNLKNAIKLLHDEMFFSDRIVSEINNDPSLKKLVSDSQGTLKSAAAEEKENSTRGSDQVKNAKTLLNGFLEIYKYLEPQHKADFLNTAKEGFKTLGVELDFVDLSSKTKNNLDPGSSNRLS